MKSILMASAALLSACSGSGSPGKAVTSTAPEAGSVYMALACDSNQGPREKSKVLTSVNANRTMGLKQMCVDVEGAHLLSKDVIHIKPRSLDEVYIEIPCADEERFNSAVRKMPQSGVIALIANDKVIASYQYLDKKNLDRRCGVLLANSIEQSVEICSDVEIAMGRDGAACMNLCDQLRPEAISNVCVIANAKFDRYPTVGRP